MSARRRAGGFTLIELMVVVVILGVLAAVAGTTTLRIVSKSRKKMRAARKALAQQALQVRQYHKTKKGMRLSKSVPSSVVSSRVRVRLRVSYSLEKGKVIPVYKAQFEARYALQNPTQKPLHAMVAFPFPRGAGTFSNLQFLVRSDRAGRPTSKPVASEYSAPRQGVRIVPQGVFWRRRFAPGERVGVKIQYSVRGRDKYRYLIAPGKKKRFHFAMDVSGVDPVLPARALQPGKRTRTLDNQSFVNRYVWDFRDFLTTEHIEVRFPPQFSKYHRFSLLGKLGVIALLFFGLFFWYFGEQTHPEKIRTGRRTQANFGLLFLSFISFFPLFIFLEDHVSMGVAMGIALSSSCVLSTGHVASFMGFRWAVVVSFPLQLFFTAGFTFAVLVPTYRPLAFTVGAIILVAFIIIAHARYQKQKQQREAEEAARKAEQEAEQEQRRAKLEAAAAIAAERAQQQQPSFAVELHEPPPKAPPKHHHCLFCRATVDPGFKHCNECGERLQRTHSCSGCDEQYWYPSVQEFRYCRKCGTHLHPPPSPLSGLHPKPEAPAKPEALMQLGALSQE